MAGAFEQVRCEECSRLLFESAGAGTAIKIKCKCGRFCDEQGKVIK